MEIMNNVKAMDNKLLVAQWVHAEMSMRNGKYMSAEEVTATDAMCGACEREMVERKLVTWDKLMDIDEDDEFTGNEIAC